MAVHPWEEGECIRHCGECQTFTANVEDLLVLQLSQCAPWTSLQALPTSATSRRFVSLLFLFTVPFYGLKREREGPFLCKEKSKEMV